MSTRSAQDLSAGFSFLETSRYDAAAGAFRRAVVVSPSETIGLYGAGFSELRRANVEPAIALLTRAAVAARPDTPPRFNAEAHIALGHCLKLSGATDGSRRSYRRASILEPGNAGIQASCANGSDHATRNALAIRATIAAPGNADYWNNRGLVTSETTSINFAEQAYRRALVLNPGHPHAWSNLAILDKRRDLLRRAVRGFDRARMLAPDRPEALLNLGRNLLLIGEFERGWRYLEAPWRARGLQPRDGAFSLPVWDGEALEDGCLLLWSEEKIGEEIMFSTMLEDVARRAGAPVTLLCDSRFAELPRLESPAIQIRGWARGTSPPVRLEEYAACYPLEFVGRFVRRSFADFPAPRLQPREKAAVVGSDGRRTPRVGMHWRSVNPLVGAQKSTELSAWGPILSVPGITFINLQYGTVTEELDRAQKMFGAAPLVLDGIDQLVDMRSFTEMVSGLDLVISVSSTSAHVAASLGLPTWVLLPRGPGLSWFWFENRHDSPWYPACRLYRQDQVGEWNPVLEQVGRDLAAWRENLD